jgi:hypothetical protein
MLTEANVDYYFNKTQKYATDERGRFSLEVIPLLHPFVLCVLSSICIL